MTITRIARVALAGLIFAGLASSGIAVPSSSPATASPSPSGPKPTVVLVHGAFADGTCWQHVIPILERDGYGVIAVQNPLSSLDEDVRTTKRVIDVQVGPVVVVGHSYGGAVITGAAAGNANVKALVYMAAFAPEAGEPVGAFGEKYPAPLGAALRPDAAGFLYIDRAQFHELFAKDVSTAEARVMAATQTPVAGSSFGASVEQAAWKTTPSWYIVTQDDQALNPELQRFYAKRMGATTKEIKSSHVVFISHPVEVARFIEQAASAPAK
jgi:pimeloyl-ACP methyl ester carboxylesterase